METMIMINRTNVSIGSRLFVLGICRYSQVSKVIVCSRLQPAPPLWELTCHLIQVYRVGQKVWPQTYGHNSVKS